MNTKNLLKKLTAMMLSLIIVLGMIPLTAVAENTQDYSGCEIIDFAPLANDVALQTVPVDTELPALNLPTSLMATISAAPPSASMVEESSEADIDVPVIWQSLPEYDSSMPGVYVFAPTIVGDFIVSATPPSIAVTVSDTLEAGLTQGDDFLLTPQNEINISPQIEGSAGNSLSWALDLDTGLLEIRGMGDMWDWSEDNPAPWYYHRTSIRSVHIYSGATSIGARAFADLENLATVYAPDSITQIGVDAYDGAINLIQVHFYNAPSGFMGIQPMSSGANPGLDLLLSGYNLFGDTEFSRSNTIALVTPVGRAALEQENATVGFMHFTGGNRATYQYSAASSMEALAKSNGMNIFESVSRGIGYDREVKVGVELPVGPAKIKAEQVFKTSANARFSKTKQNNSANSYSTSYENFFSVMEIRRELGRNYIIDINSLRTNNALYWNALSQDARDTLLGVSVSGSNMELLFGTYGTHIITSYNFGGRAEHYTSIIRTSSQSQDSIMNLTGNSSSGGVNILGLQASSEKNKTTIEMAEELEAKGRYEYSAESHVFGGNMGLGSALNPKSSPADLDNWLNSISPLDPVNTTEIFVDSQLELVGIWELLPPGNEARQAEIQKAFLDKYYSFDMGFFGEYIYNVANIVVEMEKPQYDGSYYTISTAAELAAIGSNATTLSRNYILTNDIDLSGVASWTPIGSQSSPFTGRLEGNGHTVRGIQVAPNSPAPGLFGYNNGIIRYLGTIYSSRHGGVAGANSGTITDCYVEFAHKTPTQTIEIANTTTVMPAFTTAADSTVLINFTNRTTLGFGNMSITVPSTVQTVVFRSDGRNYTALNITVQGNNTDVVFENFNFRGTPSSTAAAALYFAGSNPGLVLRGTSNTITGFGRFANSNGNRAVVEANSNLYICGNANFTVEHSNTASSTISGDSGKDAIWAGNMLNVALRGVTLTATGGDGRNGPSGTSGDPGSGITTDGWYDGNPGEPGVSGGSGGNGGNGISAIRINIYNNSTVNMTGGKGGNGGSGGRGGNGAKANDRGGSLNRWHLWGGNGGNGGNGANGGNGGTPLSVSNNSSLNFYREPYSAVSLTAGAGGNGGLGGNGGNGGNGGVGGLIAGTGSRHRGGNGGRGGRSGDGGLNGSLAVVSGISQDGGGISITNTPTIGGYGGTAGSGTYGSSDVGTPTNGANGAVGVSHQQIPTTSMKHDIYAQISMNTNSDLWTTRLHHFTIGISSPDNRKLSYYPGEVFDPSGFVFRDKNGSAIQDSAIDFKYDFSNLGLTLVTATYYVGSAAIVRYIPVTVVRPSVLPTPNPSGVDGIRLRLPAKTHFYIGQDFNYEGIALEINYSDGHSIVLTDLTVTPPSNPTSTVGTKTVSVSRPAYAGTVIHPGISAFSGSYSITVENDYPVKLEVINYPTVVQVEGNSFNPSGMSFGVEYMSGDIKTVPSSGVFFSHGLLGSPNPAFPITATYIGAVVVSCTFTVEVRRDPITHLELRPPLNPNFFAGDIFNHSGITISAVRESQRRTDLPWSEIEVTPNGALLPSDNELVLRYFDAIGGVFINLPVPITVTAVAQTGIEIDQMPTKQDYIEGQYFDSTGMVIDRVFNNGSREKGIVGYALSHGALNLNDSVVTVVDNGFEEDVDVRVSEKRVIDLEYTRMPTKTEYEEGELFNPAGMVVKGTYDNGYVDDNITGYAYTPDEPLVIGDTEVVVSFGGESFSVPITVTEVKPTGVTLNRASLTLYVGDTGILFEAVLPDNAAEKTVIWNSSQPSIASVDEFGIITAEAEGVAVITATTVEGNLTASCTVSVITDAASILSVTSASALPSKTIAIDIYLANNPGFAGMSLKVSFPQELTLIQYDLGSAGLFSGFTGPDGIDPGAACSISDHFYFAWGRTANYSQDGTIATLTFEIAPDAKPGEYPIFVTFEQHNGPHTPVNLQGHPLEIYIVDGTVIALSHILGNVTDSGEIGPADLVRLARWIAGHQGVDINETAADITGTGLIGPADLVRLARWIAGHFGDVTLDELRTRPDAGGE